MDQTLPTLFNKNKISGTTLTSRCFTICTRKEMVFVGWTLILTIWLSVTKSRSCTWKIRVDIFSLSYNTWPNCLPLTLLCDVRFFFYSEVKKALKQWTVITIWLVFRSFWQILFIYLFIYEFLSRIASSVLKVNCYQWGSCVGGPSAFNSPFGHRSRSHNICPLDNHLSGLSISLSSLVLSWVYRLPFFKSLVWLGCDSNSQPSVLVANTLPLHYQSVDWKLNTQYKVSFYLHPCPVEVATVVFVSSVVGFPICVVAACVGDVIPVHWPVVRGIQVIKNRLT